MIETVKFNANGALITVIDGVAMTVPDDLENRHRQMIAEWEAEGNTIPPYAPPTMTDEEKRTAMPPLSARQFRLGMIASGITLASVQAAVDGIFDPTEREIAQVEWEYATQFERLHPLVVQLSGALGLSGAQVDSMWEAAGAL
ncbi:hypothetical protein JYP52_03910 [Nitratireductor aquibiodomus]|uniref:hypothetical protein n=1 Tax=Nitratireductor aquibiodomus TaxID=204799 RepID=UPI0019D3303F|nr:hypothetical protein [Nitratireductor aquibiodomus]MBN7760268.1 hypothetical protein [Nitratireductor aquibiodomus]